MADTLQPKPTSVAFVKRNSSRARVLPGDRSTLQSTTSTLQTRTRDSDTTIIATERPDQQHHQHQQALQRWWRRVQRKYSFWGRYSVGKLHDFSDYQTNHSVSRTLALLVLTPLPSIIILVALLAIPLSPPSLPASSQTNAIVRSFVSHIGASLGITLVVKQALELSDRVYPYWRCLLLACLASGTNETLWTSVSFVWRFPIPFRELLIAGTWVVWFVLFHYALMRDQFALKRRRLSIYAPVFTVEFGMFYVFLALTVLFAYAQLWQQVLLVVVVPPIKVMTKRLVWRLTRQLEDLSTDVTVCVVEITAAMYQSLVMQYAKSPLVPVLFFCVDLTQAAVETALVVDHGFLVRGETAFAAALDIVAYARATENRRTAGSQSPQLRGVGHSGSGNGSQSRARVPLGGTTKDALQSAKSFEGGKRSVSSLASPVPAVPPASDSSRRLVSRASSFTRRLSKPTELLAPGAPTTTTTTTPSDPVSAQFLDFHTEPTAATTTTTSTSQQQQQQIVDGLPIPRASDARLLTQLLRLLFSSEMLLFVEFMELVMALLYLIVFGLAYVLPGGKYLVPLMALSSDDFATVMAHAGLNLVLEVVSFLLAFWLLHRKCGLATMYQIAYVLEHYWMTIQGKIVACLLLLFNLASVHQGTDLTFRFEFGKVPNG